MHRTLRILCGVLLSVALPGAAFAQRRLYWDTLDVTAHLDAAGQLQVTETQTIVFNGDWNGGERRFTVRPRQQLRFDGMSRETRGGWQALAEDPRLDDVDDYAIDGTTLRWRSRQPSDRAFEGTAIRYQIRYALSPILGKKDDLYTLDHDFAFADRDGPIQRFTLRLTLDPAWQPPPDLQETYAAGPLPPGRTFVLHLPLRHTGTEAPATIDLSFPRDVQLAIALVLGVTALAVGWFFVREQSYGRFAPVAPDGIDDGWLREHILKYPAEVVGAAWDEEIGPPEVVALIARMTAEGKLQTEVSAGADGGSSMTLRLKADRTSLEGHERTLIEALFFDGRSETSTEEVRAHYHEHGFDPAAAIRRELEAAVDRLLSPGKSPRSFRIETLILFLGGVGVALAAAYVEGVRPFVVVGSIGMLILAFTGWIAGFVFRGHIHWGWRAALACLAPAFAIAAGLAWMLSFVARNAASGVPPLSLLAVVTVAIALMSSTVNALKSRRPLGAIALRKRLAAGREFFAAELGRDLPAVRDEWYPWIVAFGLGPQMDDWSSRRPTPERPMGDRTIRDRTIRDPMINEPRYSPPEQQQSGPAPEPWSGFGGGRSGGAGASASWAAAAGGMAAVISPPQRESQGGSGRGDGGYGGGGWSGSSSSSSSSSSSGSSGGGGGGGW